METRAYGEDMELEDLSPSQGDHLQLEASAEVSDWDSDDDKNARESRRRRESSSTVQSFMLYTPDEERSVIKKFDRRLVFFVAFLYMLSFLDRSSKSAPQSMLDMVPDMVANMSRYRQCSYSWSIGRLESEFLPI